MARVTGAPVRTSSAPCASPCPVTDAASPLLTHGRPSPSPASKWSARDHLTRAVDVATLYRSTQRARHSLRKPLDPHVQHWGAETVGQPARRATSAWARHHDAPSQRRTLTALRARKRSSAAVCCSTRWRAVATWPRAPPVPHTIPRHDRTSTGPPKLYGATADDAAMRRRSPRSPHPPRPEPATTSDCSRWRRRPRC